MTPKDTLEDWERAYPHRLDLADISGVCLAVHGDRAWPAGIGPEDGVVRAQISAAYQVEKRARAFMGGRQFTGVQTDKRGVLVDDVYTVRSVASAWKVAPCTPEVQAWVDRALGCLRQCFDRGMVVLMWDRPGYDDITPAFQSLLSFASDPEATPVVLDWVPPYLGERHREAYLVGGPATQAAQGTLDVVVTTGMRWLTYLPLAAAFAVVAWVSWNSQACGDLRHPRQVVPCATQLARLRASIGGASPYGMRDDQVARRETLALLDAGRVEEATARIRRSDDVMLHTLVAPLATYSVECAVPRR